VTTTPPPAGHITRADLGAAVCRAIVRNHPEWPLRTPLRGDDPWDWERTPAAGPTDEHTVTLSAFNSCIQLLARGAVAEPGLYAPILLPGAPDDAPNVLQVPYPPEPARIVSDGFYLAVVDVVRLAVDTVRAAAREPCRPRLTVVPTT
jgi:hypothetical protein